MADIRQSVSQFNPPQCESVENSETCGFFLFIFHTLSVPSVSCRFLFHLILVSDFLNPQVSYLSSCALSESGAVISKLAEACLCQSPSPALLLGSLCKEHSDKHDLREKGPFWLRVRGCSLSCRQALEVASHIA